MPLERSQQKLCTGYSWKQNDFSDTATRFKFRYSFKRPHEGRKYNETIIDPIDQKRRTFNKYDNTNHTATTELTAKSTNNYHDTVINTTRQKQVIIGSVIKITIRNSNGLQ